MFKRIKAAWDAFLEQPYKQVVQDIEKEIEKQKFETEPKKHISEPVISIVKTFNERGRWKVYGQGNPLAFLTFKGDWSFSVEDTATGEKYHLTSEGYHNCFSVIHPYKYLCFPYKLKTYSLPSWMTKEEKAYVAEAFDRISKRVAARMELIDDRNRVNCQKQAQVNKDKERKRLMEVYCK